MAGETDGGRLVLMSTHDPGSSRNARESLATPRDLTRIADRLDSAAVGRPDALVWAFKSGTSVMRADEPLRPGDVTVTTSKVGGEVVVERLFPVLAVLRDQPDVAGLLEINWRGDGWDNIVLLDDPIVLTPPAPFAELDEAFDIRPGTMFAAKFIHASLDDFLATARDVASGHPRIRQTLLGQLERTHVLSAIEEYDQLGEDAFLDRYGFHRPKEYWLEHEGRRYASKAIVGAAVGRIEGQTPLRASEFSGGEATVASALKRLGFTVRRTKAVDRQSGESSSWTIEPGAIVTCAEISAQYGGAVFGGIQPSTRTPNVFVYSDPETSADIYPYDGWSEDQTVFLYTGEGQQGDQQLTKGNKAILQHRSDGRTLRVFAAEGHLDGTSTRTHRYLGAFEVDDRLPYVRQPAADTDGEERSVIVFRLRPIGKVERRKADRSQTGDVAPAAQSQLVSVESNTGGEYVIQPSQPTTGSRRESDLVERFINQHPSGKDAFQRYQVRPKGELSFLFTDIYDTTTSTLYEAKGRATRNAVREAIGQLLDYRRHITPPPKALAVLLPSRPTDDLVDLITSLGMHCVSETVEGTFVQHTAS